ncbi:MAG: hypothetical protein V3U29_10680 [Phycisphaeraceae bacterium]
MPDNRFPQIAAAYQPRSRTLDEPAQLARFFIQDDDEIKYDPKAVEKNLTKNNGEGLAVLKELADRLATIDPWSGEAAHDLIRSMAEEKGVKMGAIAQPLRVAVSGTTVTPPIDATLEILGKQATLNRIDLCLIHHMNTTPDA